MKAQADYEIFTLARDIRTYSQSGTMDPEFRQYLDLATGFSEDPGFADPTVKNDMETTNVMDETTLALAPLGTGLRRITQAPEVVQLSNPFPEQITEPSALRKEFWKSFDAITENWPKIIQMPEGPIAWNKSKTGDKLRYFKQGEPAKLHFIAAANLPEILENSILVSVEPEQKGDRTVAEIHRRYTWADFPNGERRHILLTIERMSEHADAEKQTADQAYSSEVLGVSLEVLNEHKSADVVTLPAGEETSSSRNKADTSTHQNFNRFRSGIKPEHQFIESVAPSENDPTLSIGQKGTSREGKTKSDQDQFGPRYREGMNETENEERLENAIHYALSHQKSIYAAGWRKGLGRIDLPWGTPGDKRNDFKGGKGISHILAKHREKDVRKLANVIATGEILPHQGSRGEPGDPSKRQIETKLYIAVVVHAKESNSWILTGFTRRE